jgi:lysyl-tRNA synthetase class 1
MLLNLAAVANSDNPTVLWGFLRRYAPNASPENHPRLDALVRYAVAYFRDFVAPKKRYRLADEVERAALSAVSAKLSEMPAGATPERPGVSNDFFNMVYAVLLGEERGPRLGSFIALYGLAETRALIDRALAGELVEAV